jgi:hypothetical protein
MAATPHTMPGLPGGNTHEGSIKGKGDEAYAMYRFMLGALVDTGCEAVDNRTLPQPDGTATFTFTVRGTSANLERFKARMGQWKSE